MPKNHYLTTPIMSDKQRLDFWQGGTCPYCGTTEIVKLKVKNGGVHYRCRNPKCKAENHFSRRRGSGDA